MIQVKRLSIQSYLVNDQDAIRRAYIQYQFKAYAHIYPKRRIGNRDHQFNFAWFYEHDRLEYSIKKDSKFCFVLLVQLFVFNFCNVCA